jgi:hypothetical protein
MVKWYEGVAPACRHANRPRQIAFDSILDFTSFCRLLGLVLLLTLIALSSTSRYCGVDGVSFRQEVRPEEV